MRFSSIILTLVSTTAVLAAPAPATEQDEAPGDYPLVSAEHRL